MANHLTPDEMAEAVGMRTERLMRYCLEQSIPIYNGRVDKTLVVTSLLETGHRFPADTDTEDLLAA